MSDVAMTDAAAAAASPAGDASTFDANAANSLMDRYSRQIAALGVETMRSLGSLCVLVIGQRGVGVEAAKDLILQGPKAVTVYDEGIAEIADLGTNFYLTADDVGVNKRSVVAAALSELNPYVEVVAHEGELTEAFIQTFGAVIVTVPMPSAELFRINAACRAAGAVFLWANTQGGFCSFFADFGAEHTVTDADGEPRRDLVVQSISNDLVTVTSEAHGLGEGDEVIFSEIEGPLAVLNGVTGVRVKRVYSKNLQGRSVLVPNQFRIDLSKASAQPQLAALDWANGGGMIAEVKPSVVLAFKPLEESLLSPGSDATGGMVPHIDQGKTWGGVAAQLHLATLALLKFRDNHDGQDPALHSRKDARECVALAEAIVAAAPEGSPLKVDAVCKDIISKAALYARTEITGFCAFLGGVAAQEVLKKFGKWTPAQQWVYHDVLAAVASSPPVDSVPQNTRYDHQIALWGKAFQHQIQNERWFLVGCGALGCEYLKAFALMGLGTGPGGRVYLTDMDRIELSNLSRQFLFRAEHVGKSKSVCAAEVASRMNPALGRNVVCYEAKVCAETEDVFSASFWRSLTGVWNALDNVQARRYTDGKCLLHALPLLESGTQGTKANSEVILPFKTKSYSDIKDQETGGIAACTLRNFPNLILHCIEWAKPKFQETFELLPAQANALLADPARFWETAERQGGPKAQLKFLREALGVLTAPREFGACIQLAQRMFVECHRDTILNLTAALPEDARVIEPGTGADLGPFWTGAKRFPRVAHLDIGRAGEREAASSAHGANDAASATCMDDEGATVTTPPAPANSNVATAATTSNSSTSSTTAANEQPDHMRYLYCAANLFAVMLGVPEVRDVDAFAALARAQPAPAPYVRPAFLDVQIDDRRPDADADADADADGEESGKPSAHDEEAAAVEAELAAVTAQLRALDLSGASALVATEFEKDDDANLHVDMVAALANTRAWNYKIRPATRLHVKTVAGKIIAALATTTAMITGLTCLEYCKLALGLAHRDKGAFANTNVNLAVSVFNAFEPDDAVRAAPVFSAADETLTVPYPRAGFSPWDFVELHLGADVTVAELVEAFPRAHYGVRVLQLFKDGLSEDDIEAGRGQPLVVQMDDVVPRQAMAMLARKELSENLRAQFQRQVDDAAAFNAAKRAKYARRVLDLYVELYGPLADATADFVVLDGAFEAPEGEADIDDHPQLKETLCKGSQDPDSVAVRAAVPKIKLYFDPSKVKMTA